MAKDKKNTSSSDSDDIWINLLIGLLCIVPFIAGFLAWVITIPFCYYLVNRKIYKFRKFKQSQAKDKFTLPLIIFVTLLTLINVLMIVFIAELSKNGVWFDTSNLTAILESVFVIFFGITDLFTLSSCLVIWYRQRRFNIKELDIIIQKENKSVADKLEKPSFFKSVWDALNHKRLETKLFNKLENLLIDTTLDDNKDVILNQKERVIVANNALKTGTLILGSTGTGKTNTIMNFIKQAVRTNKLVVFVNGKSDEGLKNQLAHLAKEHKYNLLHWNLSGKEVNFNYNILKDKNAEEIISLLLEIENYEAIARAGKFDVLHYSTLSQMIYEFYIPFMQKCYCYDKENKALDFDILYKYCNYQLQLDLLNHCNYFFPTEEARNLHQRYVNNKHDLSIDERKRLREISKMDEYDKFFFELRKVWGKFNSKSDEGSYSTKSKNQQKMEDQWEQISNTLYLLNKINVNGILNSNGDSLKDLIQSKNKFILFFNMDATSNPVQVGKIGRLIIMDIRQQFANLRANDKKLCFVCDEFSSYATNAIADVLEKGRSSGNETIISAQTIAGIKFIGAEFKDRLMGNTDTKIIHRINNAQDAEELAHIFGTTQDIAKTYQTSEGELSEMGSARQVESFTVHPNNIKRCANYHAYILTLRKQQEGTKGLVKLKPMIYDGEVKIDHCGIDDSNIKLDCSRITRQKKVASMTKAQFEVFRKASWNTYKQKNKLDQDMPSDYMPTKASYVETGENYL